MSAVDLVITWSITAGFYALSACTTGHLFHDNKDRLTNESADARLAAAILVGAIWPLAWLYVVVAWLPRAATAIGTVVARFWLGLGDLIGPRLTALMRWRRVRRGHCQNERDEAPQCTAFPNARIHKQ